MSLKPELRRAAACAIALTVAAALTGCGGRAGLRPPKHVDDETLTLVDRTAENEIAAAIEGTLLRDGLERPTAGVYDFDFVPYQPVLFVGAGIGSIDRRRLLDDIARLVAGTDGVSARASETTRDGGRFLCVGFDAARVMDVEFGPHTLVALSAACAWAEGNTSAVAVRVRGGDVAEVLKWSAELRDRLGSA